MFRELISKQNKVIKKYLRELEVMIIFTPTHFQLNKDIGY